MGLGKVLVLRQRRSKRTNRQVELPLTGVDASKLVVRVGIAATPQRDRRAQFLCCVRYPAKAVQRIAQVVVRARESRVLLDGFAVSFDTFFQVAHSGKFDT